MLIINYILIVVIFLAIAGFLFWYYTKLTNSEEEIEFKNPYTIKYITEQVSEEFSAVLKSNIKEQNLSRREMEARESTKQELKISLKESAYGNPKAKQYVKNFIKDIIRGKKIGITEENIDNVINFINPKKLTVRDKFEIMMYFYMAEYGKLGFIEWINDYDLIRPKTDEDDNIYYDITEDEIHNVYAVFCQGLTHFNYEDKLEILAQRVFATYKGFGAVDLLFDFAIDEIDLGVSGVPQNGFDIETIDNENVSYSYESVWIVAKGLNVQLSFLSLESQDELVRIASNIYKYNAPYSLSRRHPKVVSTMKDGSRVQVARPPLTDSWVVFVRKFDSMPSLKPEAVIVDDNNVVPLTVIKWLIKGYANIAITGMQGTGKTTLLKSIIRYIPRYLNIRVQELEFETNLRYTYPDRNIVTLQETDTVTAQDGLNAQKKMNGSCNILGEVATAEAASWLIQTSKVASLFALFTYHTDYVKELITAIRNNLLDSKGGAGFQNEKAAEDMVVKAINIDINMKNIRGHRFCSRITEIIPIEDRRYPSEKSEYADMPLSEQLIIDTIEHHKRVTDRELFATRDLVVFENGKYVFKNMPSKQLMEKICNSLSVKDAEKCLEELENLKKYA